MITSINELKTLTKHISCKCKFDGRKSSDQKSNKDKCRYEFKDLEEHHVCEESYIRKVLESIIGNSVITCD